MLFSIVGLGLGLDLS